MAHHRKFIGQKETMQVNSGKFCVEFPENSVPNKCQLSIVFEIKKSEIASSGFPIFTTCVITHDGDIEFQ